MKKFVLIFMFVLMPLMVSAKDITDVSTYKINDTIASKLKDNNENSYLSISKGSTISITSEEDIYGIYIIYELSSQTGNININNKNINIGVNNFLHEYIDLKVKNLLLPMIMMLKLGKFMLLGKVKYRNMSKYGRHLVKKQMFYYSLRIVMMNNYSF